MAVLSNVKTWNKTRIAGTGASNAVALRDLFYLLKNHLVSVGFSVVSSCDGTGNYGSTDYWASGANIVNAAAGSNHSWMVLSNSNISSGFQLCVDFASGSSVPRIAYFYISVNGTGFTGGTAVARPTATDEAQLPVLTELWSSYSSGTAPTANIFSSSDQQNYAIFFGPTTVRGMMLFGRAATYTTDWTTPVYALVNSGTAVHANHDTAAEAWTTSIIGGTAITLLLGTLMVGTTRALTSANVAGASGDAGGAWPGTPVWLISNSAAYPGILGYMPDLWWMHNSTTLATGDTFPSGASALQVLIGNFAVGNNGTAFTL